MKASLSGCSQGPFSGGNSSNSGNSNVTSSVSTPGGEAKKMGVGGSGIVLPGSTIQATNSAPTSSTNLSQFSANARVLNSGLSSEPRPGDTVHVKRENPVHDPYEFNAKVEDKIELPPKKLKIDKVDSLVVLLSLIANGA